jgi:predicted DNA-binding transcriptional regulator YafY
LDEAIEKIGCLIPEEKEEEYKSKSEWIAFDIERWGTSDRQQTLFKDLHQAISEQKTVCFSYTNHNSSTLTRTVEPMTLLFKSYSWYLFGFCRIRRDFRLFKLSRIRNFSFLNDRFVRKQKSYRDILSKNGTSAKFVDLELHFISQAKNKVEEFFEPGQIRINPDGSLMVAISVPEDEWIYSWILSFGDTVTVVRPRHIRDRLLEILKKMGKKYVT